MKFYDYIEETLNNSKSENQLISEKSRLIDLTKKEQIVTLLIELENFRLEMDRFQIEKQEYEEEELIEYQREFEIK